jgi:hypothetical protein
MGDEWPQKSEKNGHPNAFPFFSLKKLTGFTSL